MATPSRGTAPRKGHGRRRVEGWVRRPTGALYRLDTPTSVLKDWDAHAPAVGRIAQHRQTAPGGAVFIGAHGKGERSVALPLRAAMRSRGSGLQARRQGRA